MPPDADVRQQCTLKRHTCLWLDPVAPPTLPTRPPPSPRPRYPRLPVLRPPAAARTNASDPPRERVVVPPTLGSGTASDRHCRDSQRRRRPPVPLLRATCCFFPGASRAAAVGLRRCFSESSGGERTAGGDDRVSGPAWPYRSPHATVSDA